MILIIDYGMGNIGSIGNMLRRLGAPFESSGSPEALDEASGIILPGVGSFDEAMLRLRERDLVEAIERRVLHGRVPILGICLGMQIMMEGSEEGSEAGLGWIGGRAVRFRPEPGIRIPHMGWNFVEPVTESALFESGNEPLRFYFLHSYHCVPSDESDRLAITEYGQPFVSAFGRENIMGVQFHPERSHRFGLALLDRFAALC